MSKKEQVADNLSIVLKGLRDKNNWSQSELALKLDVSAMSIRRYENKQIGKGLDFDFVASLAKLAATPEESLYYYLASNDRQALKGNSPESGMTGFLGFLASAEPAILAKLDDASKGLGSARATELANYCHHYLQNDRLGQLEALIDSCRTALAIDELPEAEQQAIKTFLKKVTTSFRKALLNAEP